MLNKIGRTAIFVMVAALVLSTAGCLSTKSQLESTEDRLIGYTNDGLDKVSAGLENVGEAIVRVDEKANQAQATAEEAKAAANAVRSEVAKIAKAANVALETETAGDKSGDNDRKAGEGAMLPPKELKYFARGTHVANVRSAPVLKLKDTSNAVVNANQRNASVGDFKGMMDMVGFNPTEGTSFTRGYDALNFRSAAKFHLKDTSSAVVNYNQLGAEINPGAMAYVWDRKKSVYTKGFEALNYENTKKFNAKNTKDAVIIIEDLDVVPSDQ